MQNFAQPINIGINNPRIHECQNVGDNFPRQHPPSSKIEFVPTWLRSRTDAMAQGHTNDIDCAHCFASYTGVLLPSATGATPTPWENMGAQQPAAYLRGARAAAPATQRPEAVHRNQHRVRAAQRPEAVHSNQQGGTTRGLGCTFPGQLVALALVDPHALDQPRLWLGEREGGRRHAVEGHFPDNPHSASGDSNATSQEHGPELARPCCRQLPPPSAVGISTSFGSMM